MVYRRCYYYFFAVGSDGSVSISSSQSLKMMEDWKDMLGFRGSSWHNNTTVLHPDNYSQDEFDAVCIHILNTF